MNKKFLSFFSLALMLALTVTSLLPAYSASAAPGSSVGAVGYPVNLNLVYNAKTREITLTTHFTNTKLKVAYGYINLRGGNPNWTWSKITRQYNKSRIVLKYSVPRGAAGRYCAGVSLYGDPLLVPKKSPTPRNGYAGKCITVPN